ncbi:hypothetical protein ACMHYJ_15445 [Castellaniella hirudinis]|uniref:hypothetical protein n=1 Tax=Castellaniella hirudinis TaxID=1144617 RepID=UPI0039C48225
MSTYSQELKEQVVKKMMPPHNQSVAQSSASALLWGKKSNSVLFGAHMRFRRSQPIVNSNGVYWEDIGWKLKFKPLFCNGMAMKGAERRRLQIRVPRFDSELRLQMKSRTYVLSVGPFFVWVSTKCQPMAGSGQA